MTHNHHHHHDAWSGVTTLRDVHVPPRSATSVSNSNLADLLYPCPPGTPRRSSPVSTSDNDQPSLQRLVPADVGIQYGTTAICTVQQYLKNK